MKKIPVCLLGIWLALPGFISPTLAADRVFQLVTDASVINHWPFDADIMPDFFIGLPDNFVSGQRAPGSLSAPNSLGAYSYVNLNQFDALPDGFANTYTFITGTISLDPAALFTRSIPLIKGAHILGTEPYPGHGPVDVQLLRVDNGSFGHPATPLGMKAFYFTNTIEFQAKLSGGVAVGSGDLEGFAILVEAADIDMDLPAVPFDPNDPGADPAPTLIAYYANAVLLPLARQLRPHALLCGVFGMFTDGSDPDLDPYFPALATQCIFVAMDFSSAVSEILIITDVRLVAGGLRLQWNPLPGRVYRVEATTSLKVPFQPLVKGLTTPTYLDTTAPMHPTRFYRVRAD